MKLRKEKSGLFIVSLERGDGVNAVIEEIARTHRIHGARVQAIGAIEDPELGYYDLGQRKYLRKRFEGIFELAPLIGNITLKDDAPFLHAHVSLAGPDFASFGGHLFEAGTGVVVEAFIEPLEKPLERLPCEAIGLSRWEP